MIRRLLEFILVFRLSFKARHWRQSSSRAVCGSKNGLWNATEETNTLIASVNKRSTFLFRSKIVTWEGPGHDFNNLHSVLARMVCRWRQMVMDGCGSEKKKEKRKRMMKKEEDNNNKEEEGGGGEIK